MNRKPAGQRLALIVCVAVGLMSTAARADDLVTYKHFGSLGGTGDGYYEKQLGPNSWRLTSVIRPTKPESSVTKMALYRAAELAKANSFTNVRIDSFKEGAQTNYAGVLRIAAGYKATLVVTATNAADEKNHCRVNVGASCATFDAEAALTELRPFIKINQGN